MPVALIVDDVTKSLEQGDQVLGVYLDLKKAFDTVTLVSSLKGLHTLV